MTIILLFFIRSRNEIYNIQPLTLKYILFLSYGIVLGLWSTIAIRKSFIFQIIIDSILFFFLRFYVSFSENFFICSIISFSLFRPYHRLYMCFTFMSIISFLYQFNQFIVCILFSIHMLLL